jgi:hypothetical protein
MSDPISPSVMIKVLSGLGGLIGGVTFMAFYKPTSVWDAAVRSGVSTATAIIGAAPLLAWFRLSETTNNIVAAAAIIGFCSWSVLSLLARFLVDIQDERVSIKLPKVLTRTKDKK